MRLVAVMDAAVATHGVSSRRSSASIMTNYVSLRSSSASSARVGSRPCTTPVGRSPWVASVIVLGRAYVSLYRARSSIIGMTTVPRPSPSPPFAIGGRLYYGPRAEIFRSERRGRATYEKQVMTGITLRCQGQAQGHQI